MPDTAAAEKAMKEISDSELSGKRLTVKIAEEWRNSNDSGSGYRNADKGDGCKKGCYNKDRNRS